MHRAYAVVCRMSRLDVRHGEVLKHAPSLHSYSLRRDGVEDGQNVLCLAQV